MAADQPENYGDDFLDQILEIPPYTAAAAALSDHSDTTSLSSPPVFPLGLSLNGAVCSAGLFSGHHQHQQSGLFPTFENVQQQPHPFRHTAPQLHQAFQGQTISSTAVSVPNPPTIRPRVRARRGQATDPHSIAERLRRERIAERMRALQELVPSCNKSDKAAMLDEILDYVKFLRLQVKVLSMSRLGGAGAVAQLVSDIPLQSTEGDIGESGFGRPAWESWSNEDTEREVAKLMDEDVGAAMQFLQSKALCIMPISLASLIYPAQQPDSSTLVTPESAAPS